MRYSIEDAEAISRALSQDAEFEIPPAEARGDLLPGDLATLLFNIEGHEPGEPLRVQVLEVEAPGRYIGRLVEEGAGLSFGMPVEFDERNVAWIEPPSHAALSGLFDWMKPAEPEEPRPPRPAPSRSESPFGIWAEDEPLPPPPPVEPPPPPPAAELELPHRPRERLPEEQVLRPPVVYLPYHGEPGWEERQEHEESLTQFRREEPGPMIPAEERPLTQFRREGPPPAPTKQNPFAIWAPAQEPEAPLFKKPSHFEIFKPEPAGPPVPSAAAAPFAIWKPPPQPELPVVVPQTGEPSMFSIWNPEAMAAEAAAMKQMEPWEVLVPKSEQGSMYEPEGKDPFEIFKPEPEAPMPVAPVKQKKSKKKVVEEEEEEEELDEETADVLRRASAVLDWNPPTVKEVAAILGEALNLEKVWKTVRRDRKDEDWLEGQAAAISEGSDGVPIPLHTIVNYEMGGGETLVENLFEFLDLDLGPLKPLLDEYEKTEDEEVWEQLNEVGYELGHIISEAFDLLKPGDLPGTFGITLHENFGNQEMIGYWENPEDSLSPAERRRLQLEREREEQKLEARRKVVLKKLMGNWRPMTWEQAAEFLDIHYGLQPLAARLRRAKNTKKWKADLREDEGARVILEDFGEDDGDGDLEYRVGEFLGVPQNLVDRFIEASEFGGLWDAVFYPAFESFEQAWENIRPEDLPGELLATSDESDTFNFYYAEGEGYNDQDEDAEDDEEGLEEED